MNQWLQNEDKVAVLFPLNAFRAFLKGDSVYHTDMWHINKLKRYQALLESEGISYRINLGRALGQSIATAIIILEKDNEADILDAVLGHQSGAMLPDSWGEALAIVQENIKDGRRLGLFKSNFYKGATR